MCCLYCFSRQFSGGSYSGFLFYFVVFFKKQLYFGLEGVARDKLVFGMKKHGYMSFQILNRDSYSLDFGIKPLITMFLIVFFSFFYHYYPNFCLGFPFGFSTYRVRTSYLPSSSLEAHAWCCHCPSVGFRGICCCHLSRPCSKKK